MVIEPNPAKTVHTISSMYIVHCDYKKVPIVKNGNAMCVQSLSGF